MTQLTKADKYSLATALLLLRDFQREKDPLQDARVVVYIVDLVGRLGITEQYNEMMVKMPPTKVVTI
jgi:hypothetical protein